MEAACRSKKPRLTFDSHGDTKTKSLKKRKPLVMVSQFHVPGQLSQHPGSLTNTDVQAKKLINTTSGGKSREPRIVKKISLLVQTAESDAKRDGQRFSHPTMTPPAMRDHNLIAEQNGQSISLCPKPTQYTISNTTVTPRAERQETPRSQNQPMCPYKISHLSDNLTTIALQTCQQKESECRTRKRPNVREVKRDCGRESCDQGPRKEPEFVPCKSQLDQTESANLGCKGQRSPQPQVTPVLNVASISKTMTPGQKRKYVSESSKLTQYTPPVNAERQVNPGSLDQQTLPDKIYCMSSNQTTTKLSRSQLDKRYTGRKSRDTDTKMTSEFRSRKIPHDQTWGSAPGRNRHPSLHSKVTPAINLQSMAKPRMKEEIEQSVTVYLKLTQQKFPVFMPPFHAGRPENTQSQDHPNLSYKIPRLSDNTKRIEMRACKQDKDDTGRELRDSGARKEPETGLSMNPRSLMAGPSPRRADQISLQPKVTPNLCAQFMAKSVTSVRNGQSLSVCSEESPKKHPDPVSSPHAKRPENTKIGAQPDGPNISTPYSNSDICKKPASEKHSAGNNKVAFWKIGHANYSFSAKGQTTLRTKPKVKDKVPTKHCVHEKDRGPMNGEVVENRASTKTSKTESVTSNILQANPKNSTSTKLHYIKRDDLETSATTKLCVPEIDPGHEQEDDYEDSASYPRLRCRDPLGLETSIKVVLKTHPPIKIGLPKVPSQNLQSPKALQSSCVTGNQVCPDTSSSSSTEDTKTERRSTPVKGDSFKSCSPQHPPPFPDHSGSKSNGVPIADIPWPSKLKKTIGGPVTDIPGLSGLKNTTTVPTTDTLGHSRLIDARVSLKGIHGSSVIQNTTYVPFTGIPCSSWLKNTSVPLTCISSPSRLENTTNFSYTDIPGHSVMNNTRNVPAAYYTPGSSWLKNTSSVPFTCIPSPSGLENTTNASYTDIPGPSIMNNTRNVPATYYTPGSSWLKNTSSVPFTCISSPSGLENTTNFSYTDIPGPSLMNNTRNFPATCYIPGSSCVPFTCIPSPSWLKNTTSVPYNKDINKADAPSENLHVTQPPQLSCVSEHHTVRSRVKERANKTSKTSTFSHQTTPGTTEISFSTQNKNRELSYFDDTKEPTGDENHINRVCEKVKQHKTSKPTVDNKPTLYHDTKSKPGIIPTQLKHQQPALKSFPSSESGYGTTTPEDWEPEGGHNSKISTPEPTAAGMVTSHPLPVLPQTVALLSHPPYQTVTPIQVMAPRPPHQCHQYQAGPTPSATFHVPSCTDTGFKPCTPLPSSAKPANQTAPPTKRSHRNSSASKRQKKSKRDKSTKLDESHTSEKSLTRDKFPYDLHINREFDLSDTLCGRFQLYEQQNPQRKLERQQEMKDLGKTHPDLFDPEDGEFDALVSLVF